MPTPSSPNPASASPITAPPRKATIKAAPTPSLRAASQVRVLARVADFIPIKPARIEQAAPDTKQIAVSRLSCQPIRTATTITNAIKIVYSRLRNAIAPSWIACEISRILALPGGRRSLMTKIVSAQIRPNRPTSGVKDIKLFIYLYFCRRSKVGFPMNGTSRCGMSRYIKKTAMPGGLKTTDIHRLKVQRNMTPR